MELEEKLEGEALELANKLADMKPGTEEYTKVLNHYQTVMRMLEDETRRINSNQEIELQVKKLDVERDKIELESMQKRLEADIEEEKLKQSKKSNWWQVGLKVLGGVVAVGANLATMYCMIRFNNSGETLTSFENKFIFPEKFK